LTYRLRRRNRVVTDLRDHAGADQVENRAKSPDIGVRQLIILRWISAPVLLALIVRARKPKFRHPRVTVLADAMPSAVPPQCLGVANRDRASPQPSLA
jgi:hypothetical protein